MQIRPARPVDAEALAGVQVRTWRAAYRGMMPDRVLDSLDVQERTGWWHRALTATDSGARCLVADDGRVVGFVSFGPDLGGGGQGQVYAIYVQDRRRGIGAALLGAALQEMRAAGFAIAILWVLQANADGRRFYERLGWFADGTEQVHDVGGTGLPHLRYRRDLVDLAADCGRCRALCCIGPGYARSADFAHTKPPGTPCHHLTDSWCGIHPRLRELGYPGCVAYDCFGAGQRAVARNEDAPLAEALTMFEVLQPLHEMLWYLTDLAALDEDPALHAMLRRVGALADEPPAGLDVEAVQAEAAPVLRAASLRVRRAAGRPVVDHVGADLAGADLRGRTCAVPPCAASCSSAPTCGGPIYAWPT